MMELYRKHDCHPLSGCWPALIQLPIFLGLYRSLSVDVELRQAPLLGHAVGWCSNLGAPDMLLRWDGWLWGVLSSETSLIGPYLNVLPIITIALFLVQQKLFMPPPADAQAASQQKMIKFMMIFMGIMFFKVASGLCIYFIASSLWSLAERKFLPKHAPKPSSATAAGRPAAPPAPPETGNGAPGRRARRPEKRRR
jgi:YidC/Oxa1 family membrane protein insertase